MSGRHGSKAKVQQQTLDLFGICMGREERLAGRQRLGAGGGLRSKDVPEGWPKKQAQQSKKIEMASWE